MFQNLLIGNIYVKENIQIEKELRSSFFLVGEKDVIFL